MQTVPAKTILSAYMACGWFGSHYNMNLYRGCCHGCIYCDSRSDCYHVENFDTVRAKESALETLRAELRAKRKVGIVITGSMSDSYNPFESTLKLTRGALELFTRYGFGAVVDTKSDLVTRDADVLQSIAARNAAVVNFTITTADDALCRKIEPHVCTSSARFAALRTLSAQRIRCGVLLMPLLPFVNDTEENILAIVHRAAQSGAQWIYAGDYFGVTLRQNQREYYLRALERLFPDAAVSTCRQYGQQYSCASPHSPRLMDAFTRACDDAGLLYRMDDIAAHIRRPYETQQLSLLR
ncbi:MAG: radical SAM protein [Eubacteriales bacterium]|nr:radical SAM protein [Eubacteriales bacterium]